MEERRDDIAMDDAGIRNIRAWASTDCDFQSRFPSQQDLWPIALAANAKASKREAINRNHSAGPFLSYVPEWYWLRFDGTKVNLLTVESLEK